MTEKGPHPVVSVVMPVRNGETTLSEAIDSILTQTLTDFELIIVDDGSTDGTANLLQDYQARDHRVRVCGSEGIGISAARNSGLALASAPLYACMDADDISAPDRLALQVAEFECRPRLQLLGSQCSTFRASGGDRQLVQLPYGNETLQETIKVDPTFFHPSIMARTESVRSIGGYRSALDGAEDHDLYLRLAHLGEIDILDECLLDYRLHPGQTTQVKKSRSHVASAAALYLAMRESADEKVDFVADEGGLDIDLLSLALVEHLASSVADLSRGQRKLVFRTLQALRDRGRQKQGVAMIRKQLLLEFARRFELKSALKLLRKTF